MNDGSRPAVADTVLRSADGAIVAQPDVQSGRQTSARYDLTFALPFPEGIGGVAIKSAGRAREKFDLDRSGFTIVDANCDEIDFFDAGRIKRSYYPVVERLLRAAFDGARVIPLAHTFRRSVPSSVELSPMFGTAAKRVVVRGAS